MSFSSDDVAVLKWGLMDAQVCAPSAMLRDEVTIALNEKLPSGTANGWMPNDDGTFAPIKCIDNQTRTHYMYVC